jgi:hypothetical protein
MEWKDYRPGDKSGAFLHAATDFIFFKKRECKKETSQLSDEMLPRFLSGATF